MSHSIETYHLHAYLDGELSADECLEVEKALENSAELRDKLEDFKALKSSVKQTYSNLEQPEIQIKEKQSNQAWYIPKMAVASLMLGLILGAGFFKIMVDQTPVNGEGQESVSSNYLVHLDSDSMEKQQQAIAEIETLLANSKPGMKVDLISNFKGVQLFDVNNPNKDELNRLLDKYDNLTLFACKRALSRAKESGHPVNIMPQVKHDQPAIDAVVKRLQSGWNYKKI
jgi:intracellular sulfur oxidation DsrE/DsrF family protein